MSDSSKLRLKYFFESLTRKVSSGVLIFLGVIIAIGICLLILFCVKPNIASQITNTFLAGESISDVVSIFSKTQYNESFESAVEKSNRNFIRQYVESVDKKSPFGISILSVQAAMYDINRLEGASDQSIFKVYDNGIVDYESSAELFDRSKSTALSASSDLKNYDNLNALIYSMSNNTVKNALDPSYNESIKNASEFAMFFDGIEINGENDSFKAGEAGLTGVNLAKTEHLELVKTNGTHDYDYCFITPKDDSSDLFDLIKNEVVDASLDWEGIKAMVYIEPTSWISVGNPGNILSDWSDKTKSWNDNYSNIVLINALLANENPESFKNYLNSKIAPKGYKSCVYEKNYMILVINKETGIVEYICHK